MDKVETHHRETHGMSDDMDENTPVDKVKGPNVFERAKEEIEAIVEAITSKKESHHDPTTKKEASMKLIFLVLHHLSLEAGLLIEQRRKRVVAMMFENSQVNESYVLRIVLPVNLCSGCKHN
uniref:Uncharacterized protein LOC105034676 isoform X2 n=1 Tax=Elaeis guineensis var. tenera TaxID=51953 RepID=A0A6J0PGX8_ELAGV|nr:uncharacterized protein LOC105034676 isoform X2 [Elaeis guineensis]